MNQFNMAQRMLGEAAGHLQQRAQTRDLPNGELSMARAVASFNHLVGGDRRLSETEGWLFMCCLKMARATAGKFNADDYVDLAAYAALAGASADAEANGEEEPFEDES